MANPLNKLSKEDLVNGIDVLHEVSLKLLTNDGLENSMEFLLTKAMELCPCDGATLFLLNKNKDRLNSEVMLNLTHKNLNSTVVAIPLDVKSIATYTFKNKTEMILPDVYLIDPSVGIKFNSNFDKMLNYRTKTLMSVPLINKDVEAVGVIQLINRKNFLYEDWMNADELKENAPVFSLSDQKLINMLVEMAVASLEYWYHPTDSASEFNENSDALA